MIKIIKVRDLPIKLDQYRHVFPDNDCAILANGNIVVERSKDYTFYAFFYSTGEYIPIDKVDLSDIDQAVDLFYLRGL